MKNSYITGWTNPAAVQDGHDWQSHEWMDFATCADCGITASNAEISREQPGVCPVPVSE